MFTRLLLAILLPEAAIVAESAVAPNQTVGTTSGAIAGRVTDTSGAAIAGATVTASSATLMGVRVAVSAGDGNYRFAALPPGDYVIVFEHGGFRRASSDGIGVGAVFTATVDVVMQIADVAETVTVERRSGVVDRQSTAIAVRFDATQLANLPGARSMFAILSSTPGIQVARFDVGGNSADAGGPYRAYGTGGLNRPMVEGISVAGLFPIGFTLDYGAFEEVTVGLGAHGPEWPLPGVQMQFVVKSGGNRYRGSFYGDIGHRDWQSYNIDADQQRRTAAAGAGPLSDDANRLWRYAELSADVGGFIARDRAWWYASMREQDIQIRQVNFPVAPLRTRLTNYTGKATFRLSDRHRAVVFAQPGRNTQPNRLDPFGAAGGSPLDARTAIHVAEDATSRQRTSGIVWKAEWNAAFGERLFAEARIGQFDVRRPSVPNGAAPRYEDIDTLLVTGGGRSFEQAVRRNQVHASVSFLKDGPMGSHHVKIGGEILDTLSRERWFAAFPGGVLHVLRSGEPEEVYLFLTPSDSSSGVRGSAAYAGDTWRVTERVTMNLGMRFDRYRVYLPEQAHPTGGAGGQPVSFPAVTDVLTWNVVAPRVGAAIDLAGDRKTILKGSVGRYWLAPGELGPNVNPNATEWWRRYVWRDPSGDGTWQPGEQGDQPRASRGGFAVESIDPALRASWFDEATASLERELPSAVGLRTGIVWRRDAGRYARQNASRPFESYREAVTIPDPGPDGDTGTSDDGRAITAYNVALDPTPPANIVRNVNGSDARHFTWELAAQRRLRGNWSLLAGFAHTWTAEHANGYGGQVIRQNTFVLTPNDLINTDALGRHRLRTWTATVSSTIRLPKGFGVSPLIRHQSGQPFGRTISAAMNFGVIRLLAEPIGTRRMENVTLFDVKAEKEVLRSGALRGSVFVDVFNVFNANSAQNANWASGAGFLQPITVVSPRIGRFGVRLAF